MNIIQILNSILKSDNPEGFFNNAKGNIQEAIHQINDISNPAKNALESILKQPYRNRKNSLSAPEKMLKSLKSMGIETANLPTPHNVQSEKMKLHEILLEVGFDKLDSHIIGSRPARYLPVPTNLHPKIIDRLNRLYPGGIYSHQSEAIQDFMDGNDICLATATASGKSLVFSTIAANYALEDMNSLTIAVYPARALVKDQLDKWRKFLCPLGVSVGQIDGSIPASMRMDILENSQIVAMTPDVIHSWLLKNISNTKSRLQQLKLLILDEAHIYSGVLGTNMAYLLRRIGVINSTHRIISSTATIGEPLTFLQKLTGRNAFHIIGIKRDGSPAAEKEIILTSCQGGKIQHTKNMAKLLNMITKSYDGRFLAFVDSRTGAEEQAENLGQLSFDGVLPYRSGYEEKCREDIQNALANGKLRGVISTSALEVGVDIGDIDLVIILNYPPSVQAFWQRFGRAGRREQRGECLIVDTSGLIKSLDGGLGGYLARRPESGFLYMENRTLQYGNALCAAYEIQQSNPGGPIPNSQLLHQCYPDLPPVFGEMVINEINPTQAIAPDLLVLKTLIINDDAPHFKFPLRGGIEPQFQVILTVPHTQERKRLGYLSASQRFREAYPGAIYRYMGEGYRVVSMTHGEFGPELGVRRQQNISTRASVIKKVFAKYFEVQQISRSVNGFVAQCGIQIDERIDCFTERRANGDATVITYEPMNIYRTQPLGRVINTSGVVWYFNDHDTCNERILPYLIDGFCSVVGVSSRDIGFGKVNGIKCPFFGGDVSALSIYDDVQGGLRLTDALIKNFDCIIDRAIALVQSQDSNTADADTISLTKLKLFASEVKGIQLGVGVDGKVEEIQQKEGDWYLVVAEGEEVMIHGDPEFKRYRVAKVFLSREGVRYEFKTAEGNTIQDAEKLIVTPGETKLVWFDTYNHQFRPIEQGPESLTLESLRVVPPTENFSFNFGDSIYNMTPFGQPTQNDFVIIRDFRIPGRIACGKWLITKRKRDGVESQSFRLRGLDGKDALVLDFEMNEPVIFDWVAVENRSLNCS
jgi:DEAD/DEAH box helicase domain-containing protein